MRCSLESIEGLYNVLYNYNLRIIIIPDIFETDIILKYTILFFYLSKKKIQMLHFILSSKKRISLISYKINIFFTFTPLSLYLHNIIFGIFISDMKLKY